MNYYNMIYILIICSIIIICDGNAENNTMKAAVINEFGTMDVLKILDVPLPNITENQVLVKTKAIGVNPIDVYLRSGTHYLKPTLPIILGKEFSGVVEEVDPGVTRFKKGDRVFCYVEYGAYAEYVAANESTCYTLSENLSFQQGACIYITYFTAYRGLVLKGKLKSNDTVLVHGASGTMGTAAIQISKAVGAFTVATVGEKEFENMMKKCGADYIVYHNEKDYMKTSLDKTDKVGFNVILEIVSKLRINNDKKFLAPHGQIVVVGNRLSIWPSETCVSTVSLFKYTEEEQAEASKGILEFLEKGLLNPVIRRTYPLEEVAKAHLDVSYNDAAKGKLILEIA